MANTKRSQGSIELIVISAVLLIIFLLFLPTINTNNQVALSMGKQFEAEKVGYLASSAVNEVYLAGKNTNKTIYLPDSLQSSANYSISINGRILKVAYGGVLVEFPLLTANITGSFSRGSVNQLFNSNGVIELV